jgi:hypothetical protein
MALPKKIVKDIKLTPTKILEGRRQELLQIIQEDGTYLPKGIYHSDLDRGMLDFVKNDLEISVDGKKVNTVDVIITTQNWAQFTQTWNFQDLDSNISVPFIATVRKPETPYGTNQGTTFKIPGRPTFQYALVPTFDGARNGYDVYKIPQPTPVDITYDIKIFTNRMRELNAFNKKILETFGSKQAYTLINGRYLPITLENISDESVADLGKRRYYIQTYNMKLKGVLLDEEQFERTPAVSRMLTMLDVGVKTKQRKATSPNPNENTVDGLYQFLTSNASDTLTEVVKTNFDYYLIKTDNIASYDVYINNLLMGTDIDYFQVNLNDVLSIEVTKDDNSKNSSIFFEKKLV